MHGHVLAQRDRQLGHDQDEREVEEGLQPGGRAIVVGAQLRRPHEASRAGEPVPQAPAPSLGGRSSPAVAGRDSTGQDAAVGSGAAALRTNFRQIQPCGIRWPVTR